MNDYLGDFSSGSVVRFLFNTLSGGALASFDDTPGVEVYKDGGLVPLLLGAVIVPDFNGVPGVHLVTIDSSAGGYGGAHDYVVVLSAGTVGGLDRSGSVLSGFSLDNRAGGNTVASAVWAFPTRTLTSISGTTTVVSPVGTSGRLSLVREDSYFAADARAIQISRSTWPNLTGAIWVRLTIRERATDVALLEVSGTVPVAGIGLQTVQFELSTLDTSLLVPGAATGKYDVRAKLADGHVASLEVTDGRTKGVVDVYEDQTRDL